MPEKREPTFNYPVLPNRLRLAPGCNTAMAASRASGGASR